MTAAKRISSLADFQQRMAKSHQKYSPKIPLFTGMTKEQQTDFNSNKDQYEFASSSLKVLRAKYEAQGFPDRRSDPTYLAAAYRVLRFMYDIWIKEQFVDMYFHVNGEDIPAHKIAVASYSQTLADKFLHFQKGEIIVVELNDFSRETVMTVLYFIYTTDIQIFDHTVASLMTCAVELDIEMLVRLCKDHLEKITISNAIPFFSIAKAHSLNELQIKIHKFICSHFIDIVNSPTFGQIDFERLVDFLRRDELYIKSELDIFLAIVRWIEYDKNGRLPLAPTLLKYVRFQRITPEILATDVEIYSDIFAERVNHNMLYEAMKFHALRLSGSKLSTWCSDGQCETGCGGGGVNSWDAPTSVLRDQQGHTYTIKHSMPPRPAAPVNTSFGATSSFKPTMPTPFDATQHQFSPRFTSSSDSLETGQPLMTGATVVAIGGINLRSPNNATPGRCVYQYFPEENMWSLMSTICAAVNHHAAAVIGGKLCIIGGCIEKQNQETSLGTACNALQIFDPELQTWFPSSLMNHCRAYAGVGVHQNTIYMVGGEDELQQKTDTIEKYDGLYSRWVYVARMRGGPKLGVAVTVLNDKLFIVGGYSKESPNGPILPDVECFDLTNQRWIDKKPLQAGVCHASLTVAGNKMYLIGGRMRCKDSGTMYSVATVHVYDEAEDEWYLTAKLQQPRHDASCAVIGKRIFVVGGMTSPGLECLSSVECYDAGSDSWLSGIAPLPTPSAGLACVSM